MQTALLGTTRAPLLSLQLDRNETVLLGGAALLLADAALVRTEAEASLPPFWQEARLHAAFVPRRYRASEARTLLLAPMRGGQIRAITAAPHGLYLRSQACFLAAPDTPFRAHPEERLADFAHVEVAAPLWISALGAIVELSVAEEARVAPGALLAYDKSLSLRLVPLPGPCDSPVLMGELQGRGRAWLSLARAAAMYGWLG